MHDLVLIIEVLGEATCWNILDFPLKDLRYRVAHLLENVQEEHELVLSLLAVGHILVQLIDG